MQYDEIEIGKHYKIVGDSGGCSSTGTLCCECKSFKGGIIVTDKLNIRRARMRNIGGRSKLDNIHSCSFCPADLIPWKIENWKEVMKNA